MFQDQAGFTIIEIMVTAAVAIILLAVAVPSYIDFTRSNKLTTQVNSFVQALHLARNEAVRTGGATLCASSIDSTAGERIDCNSADWLTGWIIFADYNANGTKDGDEEEIIRVGEAFPEGFVITAGADPKITFGPQGFLSPAGTTQDYSFCSGRTGIGAGRTISVNSTGRPTTVKFDGCV